MKKETTDFCEKYTAQLPQDLDASRAAAIQSGQSRLRFCLVLGAVFIIIAFGILAGSCDDIYTETDYQPWFYNYIANRVDLKDYFPRQYQSQKVTIKTVLSGSTPYILMYQNRQPDADTFLLVLSKDLQVETSLSDSRIQSPDSWYGAPDGTLRLGFLALTPPVAAGGSWGSADNTAQQPVMYNYGVQRVQVGGEVYDLHLSTDSAGNLRIPFSNITTDISMGIAGQQAIAIRDAALNLVSPTPSPPDVTLSSNFVSANRNALFPGLPSNQTYGWYDGGITSVKLSADQLHVLLCAQLIAQSNGPSFPEVARQSSKFYVDIKLPYAAAPLELLPTDMTASTSIKIMNDASFFNLSAMSGYGGNIQSVAGEDALLTFYPYAVPAASTDNGSTPYVTALDLQSGTVHAFALPKMNQVSGAPAPMIPQFQTGSNLWFVWDARNGVLYRNNPWWK